MSDYYKRYNACFGYVSTYFDTPEEYMALRAAYGQDPKFINEGYGDDEDISYGHRDFGGIEGTRVTRRTIGSVLPSTLEFLAARNETVALWERLARPA